MTKTDIVHLLAERFGYRRCLVLRTPLTGPDHTVEPKRFDVYTEMLYRCPGSPRGKPRELFDFDPGPYGFDFDVALLEPWHTYEDSLRDLNDVFHRVLPGGALVVHDCWPHKEETTHPDGWDACLKGGEWSGQTFAAWADFLKTHYGVCYRTIDTDYGVGVLLLAGQDRPQQDPDIARWATWDKDKTLANARPLINLVTPDEFKAWLAACGPGPV